MPIERSVLLHALLAGETIDGSPVVLGEAPEVAQGRFQPPFPNAESELWRPDGSGSSRFDRLGRAASSLIVEPGSAAFPEIAAADLRHAIEALAWREGAGQTRSDPPAPGQPRGVQIIGCRIVGDVDLFGLALPFSIRLIGCVIEGAVIAHHASVVTLDLSASAIRCGVYATYLRTSGALRLNRSFCTGALDFTSAHIAGEFHARECNVLPRESAPSSEAFVPDRGLFCLALARLDNELVLRGARIHGGLSLRGASIAHSAFLEDAVVSSPIGVLERVAWRRTRIDDRRRAAVEAFRPRGPGQLLPPPAILKSWWRVIQAKARRSAQARSAPGAAMAAPAEQALETWTCLEGDDLERLRKAALDVSRIPRRNKPWVEALLKADAKQIARLVQRYDAGDDPSRRWEQETQIVDDLFTGANGRPVRETLGLLLEMQPRARTCAVRAEGATIGGSLYADRLSAVGRVRLKYARISGGVHLTNCKILSASAVARSFETLERLEATDPALIVYRSATFERLKQKSFGQLDEIALDLRDASIRGAIALGEDTTRPQPATIAGVVDCTGADLDQLDLRGLTVEAIAPHRPEEAPHVLKLDHAKIRQDVRLARCRNLRGISAVNAQIDGHLLFAPNPLSGLGDFEGQEAAAAAAGERPRKGHAVLGGRAENVRGDIDLTGATVKGDVVLLFHPVKGPNLKLSRLHVEGQLQILPAEKAVQLELGAYKLGNYIADRTRRRKLHLPKTSRAGPAGLESRLISSVPRPNVRIDLDHAQATSFTHPPSAWPQQGGLFIEGFTYSAAADMGPLIPFPMRPRTRSSIVKALRPARLQFGNDQIADIATALSPQKCAPGFQGWIFAGRSIAAVLLLVLFLGSIVSAAAMLYVSALHLLALETEPWPIRWVFEGAGRASAIASSGLLAVWSSVTLLGIVGQPTREEARPMATEWLARQGTRRNRYRVRGPEYWPLEPYLQAAKVLRASGRPLSAGRVELARLRERHKMLSRRHHLVPRLFLRLVDLTSEYGFNSSRLVFISLALLLATGIAFNDSYLLGAIVPKDAASAQALPLAASGARPRLASVCPPDASGRCCPELRDPKFSGSALALDATLPLLAASEEQYWRVRETRCDATIPFTSWPLPSRTFLWLRWCLHAFGLMLTSIIATAFAARAETWLARQEE